MYFPIQAKLKIIKLCDLEKAVELRNIKCLVCWTWYSLYCLVIHLNKMTYPIDFYIFFVYYCSSSNYKNMYLN